MADVLAEAVVELEADVAKANREIKAALRQMDKDAKEATTKIDGSFKRLTGNLGKEFEQASREIARQYREQEREANRVQREIARENARIQREIEAETRRVQREIERETARVARENIKAQKELEKQAIATQREIEKETLRVARQNEKAQKEFEKAFIASQHAMEKQAHEAQERNAERFRQHVEALRKFASERISLTLGVDTSQLSSALRTATKLGAVLGVLGVGALAGQASIAGIASVALAIQDLVGAIALLPAAGSAAGVVIGTLTLGLRGLGDAIKADSAKKLDEAFKTLSENGKKLVKVVRDLKDEFDNLSKNVQQELLAGFNKEVERLAKTLLPVLEKGFVGVARELNASALSLAAFVRESQTVKDIQRIFANTQQSVFVFRRSLVPLAQAFRDLSAVGSDFLPVIAADLGGAAKRFADFIDAARESGNLALFFSNAVQALRDLFAIIGNVGGIFDAFLDNARLAFGSSGFLGLIRGVTERFNEFANSIEGQVALLNFFKQVQQAVNVVVPIIKDLSQVIFTQVLPALVKLGTVAAPAVSALIEGLRRGLGDAIPGIVSFVDALSSIVVSLVNSGVLDALGKLVRVLGTSLGEALRQLAPTLGNLVNTLLLKLTDILPKILPALGRFADAFGELVIAALPVVDVLADIVSNVGLPTLQRIAEKLTPIVEDLARSIGETLLPILPDLTDALIDWVDAMAPLVDDILAIAIDLLKILTPLLPPLVRASVQLAVALKPLLDLFADLVKPVSEFITELYKIPGVQKFMEQELPKLLALLLGTIIIPLGKLLEVLDKVATKLNDAGFFDIFIEALWIFSDAVIAGARSFDMFKNTVENVWNFIQSVVNAVINSIIGVISAGFEIIKSIFLGAWEFIKTIWNTLWNLIKIVAQTAIQTLIAVLTGNFNAIPGIISNALGRMRDAAIEGFSRLLDFVIGIPGKILQALGSLRSLLFGVGQNLVQGFIDGIGSMISAIAGQATTMGRAAVSAAQRAIDARSPSREMMSLGKDFGSGFVIGINSMIRQATNAGEKLAQETAYASATTLTPGSNSMYALNEQLNRLTRNGLGPVLPATSQATTSAAPQSDIVVQPEVRVYIGNDEINDHITEVVTDHDRRIKRSLTMGARRIV